MINKILFFFSALFLLIFSSCSNKKDELVNSIPKDAVVVLNVDIPSVIKKSDYNIWENKTVLQGINALKASLKEPDKIKLIDEFLSNPNSCGILLKKPFYVFSTPSGAGLIFSVGDSKRLKRVIIDVFKQKESNIKEEKGVFYFKDIVWDNNKIVFTTVTYNAKVNEALTAANYSKKLFFLPEDQSITANKSFKSFLKDKKDISTFYNISNDNSEVSSIDLFGYGQVLDNVKQKLKEFEGTTYGVYLSFDKGAFNADTKYYFDKPEDEKKFKEQYSTSFKEIDGDILKYVPDSAISVFASNVQDLNIADYMKDIQEDTLAIDLIQENVKGDLAFSLNDIVRAKMVYEELNNKGHKEEVLLTGSKYEYSVFMNVKDAELSKKIVNLYRDNEDNNQEGIVTISEENNIYSLEKENSLIYIGMADKNVMYITNQLVMIDHIKKSNPKNKYKTAIKGKIAYFSGVSRLPNFIIEEINDEKGITLAKDALGSLGEYSFYFDKSLESKGKLEFKEKNKNSLAVVANYFDRVLNDSPLAILVLMALIK